MTYHAKITSKGQVTIPVAVRRALGVGAGDRIILDIEDKNLVRMRPDTTMGELVGIGRKYIRGDVASFDEERAAARRHIAETWVTSEGRTRP